MIGLVPRHVHVDWYSGRRWWDGWCPNATARALVVFVHIIPLFIATCGGYVRSVRTVGKALNSPVFRGGRSSSEPLW